MKQVLGIDIAKETFDVCLMVAEKMWKATFENQPAGFKKLQQWVSKHTQAGETVHACMEATGQYGDELAEFLFQAGFQVSVVNPARIKAYANSQMRRNKTDKVDAEVIALFCLREAPALWSPPPASFKELQALVRHYDDLQTAYQQEMNRLKSGSSHPTVLEDLKEHLALLKSQMERTKKAIHAHIQANPDLKQYQALLQSIPGIGELTAAKLLGEIRDVRDFDDARQLAAYAGVTPRNFLSGTSVHKKARMSKMGNANLRKALYMPAISAKKHNPIVHAFCERLSNSGLSPKQVIGAAMRKLLHLAFGVLKSGKPFDPNFLDKPDLAPIPS
jgi:transposase